MNAMYSRHSTANTMGDLLVAWEYLLSYMNVYSSQSDVSVVYQHSAGLQPHISQYFFFILYFELLMHNYTS